MTHVDTGSDLKDAWFKARLLLGRSSYGKAYDGLCTRNGVWYINPRGGVEGVAQAVEGGVEWFGLNVADDVDFYGWETLQFRADLRGKPTFPWKRVRKTIDVEHLYGDAVYWNSKAIGINLEDEAKDVLTPSLVREIIDNWDIPEIEPIIFPPAWLYNSVDWTPLADFAFVLQMYDTPESKKPLDCVAHAHALGVRNVFFAYDGRLAPPVGLKQPWSVYGDDAAGNWWRRG